MPPITMPEYALRGLMAQAARATGKHLDAVGPMDVNPLRDATRYAEIQPARAWAPNEEMKAIVGKLYAGPFPTQAMRRYGFEYWYNYFFIELDDFGDKSQYALAVIRHDGSLYGEADMPRKKECLQGMLERGFARFEVADHLDAQALALKVHERDQATFDDFVVLFRGDGRPWTRIRADGGSKAQTRVSRLRVERGMDFDWHPFRHSGTTVWYRKGHNDACLFSAVSVTPVFSVATSFPLLAEVKAQNPAAVGHAVVVVRQGGTDTVRHLDATRTNVYAVRARGAHDTQGRQIKSGNFPEFASDDLDWTDHLVWFSITRIHLPDHMGHQVVIDEVRFLQSDEVMDRLLGHAAAVELRRWVADLARRAGSVGDVRGIACHPLVDNKPSVPADYAVVRVLNPFIAGPPKAPGLPH